MTAKDITMINMFEKGFFDGAFERMSRKKRGSGIDNIRGVDLPEYWRKNGRRIKEQLIAGEYLPEPAEKHLIPKPGKKEKRMLEIPCLIDRVIQLALYFLLDEFYDGTLRDESYAFRRGRGQRDAIFRCGEILDEGYDTVLDLDIKSFFDSVDHKLMMDILRRNISDTAVLSTIWSYLKTKVVYGRHIYRKYIGLSQGSPLSPLLANVFLNEFDTFLAEQNIAFIRYADDAVIFFRNHEDAYKSRTLIEKFLEEKCRLRINSEKTKIASFGEIRFLGYTWYKNEEGMIYMSIDNKVKDKMFTRMEAHIKKNNPGTAEWWDRQGAFNRGWVNYYRYAEESEFGKFLDEAENRQLELIRSQIRADTDDGTELKYIEGLNDSKQFAGMKEWYEYIG